MRNKTYRDIAKQMFHINTCFNRDTEINNLHSHRHMVGNFLNNSFWVLPFPITKRHERESEHIINLSDETIWKPVVMSFASAVKIELADWRRWNRNCCLIRPQQHRHQHTRAVCLYYWVFWCFLQYLIVIRYMVNIWYQNFKTWHWRLCEISIGDIPSKWI